MVLVDFIWNDPKVTQVMLGHCGVIGKSFAAGEPRFCSSTIGP